MKKPLFFILSFAFYIALSAQPYTSKDFKDVKVKFRNTTIFNNTTEVEYVPTHRTAQHAPKGGDYLYGIGETRYITATHANARNTINWSPDGKTCAATWTYGDKNNVRGTAVNYFDFTTKTWKHNYDMDTQQVTPPLERVEQSVLGSPEWGSHVFTKKGECVISHSTADGGMVINYRETREVGEWTQYILLGPTLSNGKTEIICPTTFAVGDTIHLVCVTNCAEGATYNNYTMCPLYYRSLDGGKTWEEVRTFEGIMTEQDLEESGADRYVLTARGNHVVIAYINGSAAYLESLDGGDTWERHSVYDTEWSSSSTGVWVGPTMYATTIATAIGDDDKVHIAFSAQMRHREPGDERDSLTYYPTLCGLYTWNDAQPIMTHADLNLDYDYDTQTWRSLGYDLMPNFMDAPDILGFERFKWWEGFDPKMLTPNYNNVGYISHPRLIAEKGKVYLMYSAILEQPLISPTNEFFRGVFLTVSFDNGTTYNQKERTSWLSYHPDLFWCDWSKYCHLTDSTHNNGIEIYNLTENCYPTMATNVTNNTLVFTWLNDIWPFPDTTWFDWPLAVFSLIIPAKDAGNYYSTDMWVNGCVGVDEKMLSVNPRVYPNPTTGVLNLIQKPFNNEQLTINNIEIFDIYGRKHEGAKGRKGENTNEINISHLPAGLYFLKITTKNGVFVEKVIKN